MKGSMPSWAVREAGAPAEVWVDIQAPEVSDSLYLDVIWVNKTATRLPEVSRTTRITLAAAFTSCWLWFQLQASICSAVFDASAAGYVYSIPPG